MLAGGGGGVGCCCCWVAAGEEEEDRVSFMSMSMNMVISRSAGSAGDVGVAGVVAAGGGAGPLLEPPGLGGGEGDVQNQVMVVTLADGSRSIWGFCSDGAEIEGPESTRCRLGYGWERGSEGQAAIW